MDNSGSSESDDEFNLTQEQQDKLAQLQDLTGIEDTNICRALLASNGWDMEATARQHLGIQQEPDQNNLLPPPQHPPQLNSEADDIPGSDRGNGHPPASRPLAHRDNNGLISLLIYILGLPLRIVTTSIDGAIGFITSLFGFPPRRRNTVRDPQRDVTTFVQHFNSQYGTQHPPFFMGSYSQVLEEAKKELKFVLVYLHSDHHQDTSRFCSNVLCNRELIDYISENFIVWGCSVTEPEGHRVSEALRESTYPFLGVVVLRQHRMVVVGRQEGYVDADTLITWLKNTVTEYEAFIVAARADRDERNSTREIRNEQDAIFAETLRKDQEREEKAREEEARQRQIQEDRERDLQQQTIRDRQHQEKKLRIQQSKIDLANNIPDEPDQSCKDAIRILIKLPEGQRLERRFLPTHNLSHIYYFVFCHPDSPDEFDIVTNFPRRVLHCNPDSVSTDPVTLADAGFGRSEMLFVNDLEA